MKKRIGVVFWADTTFERSEIVNLTFIDEDGGLTTEVSARNFIDGTSPIDPGWIDGVPVVAYGYSIDGSRYGVDPDMFKIGLTNPIIRIDPVRLKYAQRCWLAFDGLRLFQAAVDADNAAGADEAPPPLMWK